MKVGLAFVRLALLALLASLAACDSDDGGAAVPDAPSVTPDASATVMDAPFQCMPVAPGPPPGCLALAASTLRGGTPFGELDVALDYFGAGDCITISRANVAWTGACGERLELSFSYPVDQTGSGRVVTGSFDTEARFTFRPPGMTAHEDVTTLHVDVTTWKEGMDIHDVDITITVTDPAYTLAPLHVTGTFCDWPYYLC